MEGDGVVVRGMVCPLNRRWQLGRLCGSGCLEFA